jgi:hypothetical protein
VLGDQVDPQGSLDGLHAQVGDQPFRHAEDEGGVEQGAHERR